MGNFWRGVYRRCLLRAAWLADESGFWSLVLEHPFAVESSSPGGFLEGPRRG